tara:strand:+ start:447 stop:803 length:357 start_codon:yes stop_codon:yes gene_type:complete
MTKAVTQTPQENVPRRNAATLRIVKPGDLVVGLALATKCCVPTDMVVPTVLVMLGNVAKIYLAATATERRLLVESASAEVLSVMTASIVGIVLHATTQQNHLMMVVMMVVTTPQRPAP